MVLSAINNKIAFCELKTGVFRFNVLQLLNKLLHFKMCPSALCHPLLSAKAKKMPIIKRPSCQNCYWVLPVVGTMKCNRPFSHFPVNGALLIIQQLDIRALQTKQMYYYTFRGVLFISVCPSYSSRVYQYGVLTTTNIIGHVISTGLLHYMTTISQPVSLFTVAHSAGQPCTWQKNSRK